MAIRGERVVAVGSTAEIAAQAGASTRGIDLGGRTVVPGFNDAHAHVGPHLQLERLKTGDDPSTAELEAALADAVKRAPAGRFIQGAIGPGVWGDPAVTRAWLDARAPANPVRLSAWTGHGVILNSAALTLAGIGEDIGDPEGGRFLRDAAGRLNGRGEEYADYLISRRIAQRVDAAAATEAYRTFAIEAAKLGITSVQLMGDALPINDLMTHLVDARTSLRWHVYRFPIREAGAEKLDSRAAPAAAAGAQSRRARHEVHPRRHADRAPGVSARAVRGRARRARPPELHPRADSRDCRLGLRLGGPVLAHAVGDGAIDAYLTALEHAGLSEVWKRKRPRIEHGDLLTPDLIARVKALGVVVVQNPAHLTLAAEMPARLGDRAQQAQPLKSLLAAGVPLALGSDGPINPGLNIMFAATHPARPTEALSREAGGRGLHARLGLCGDRRTRTRATCRRAPSPTSRCSRPTSSRCRPTSCRRSRAS